VLGYLIFKSGFFPRILGVVMVVAALGYLTDAYGNMLYPNYDETSVMMRHLSGLLA
jgi:hypothetical protein